MVQRHPPWTQPRFLHIQTMQIDLALVVVAGAD